MTELSTGRSNTVLHLVSGGNDHGATPKISDTISTKGSGDGGGGMEPRVARLESDVENIKITLSDIKSDVREIKRDARTDFRLLFGTIITVALGLAGLMAKGFHWL